MNFIFCKHKNLNKHEFHFFCKLKKPQKTWNSFFASLKKLYNVDFIFAKSFEIMGFFIRNFLSKSCEIFRYLFFSNKVVSFVFEKIFSGNNVGKTLNYGVSDLRIFFRNLSKSCEIFRIFSEDHHLENSMIIVFDKIIWNLIFL